MSKSLTPSPSFAEIKKVSLKLNNSFKFLTFSNNNSLSIKSIGIASRIDIEKILYNKVNLKINVKYKKDWSNKKEHYEDIGLSFE